MTLVYCILGIILGYGSALWLGLTKEYALAGIFVMIGTLFVLRLFQRLQSKELTQKINKEMKG